MFDIQAHRGGMGLTVENTIPAFEKALRIGVTTLEFDVQITKDGHAVVAHDRDPQPGACLDTEPAFPGDPMFPYVSDEVFIIDLTLAQVRTIDYGTLRNPRFPEQEVVPGARIPLLTDVFDLVRRTSDDVRLNLELKIEAELIERTAPREVFVEVIVPLVVEAGLVDRLTIESFDWGALQLVRQAEPRLGVIPLADARHFGEQERALPWWGGLEFGGAEGFIAAARELGAVAISPQHDLVTSELVAEAHAAGLRVVPWTVDDPERLRELIGLGVDGVITNRPDIARDVVAETMSS